MRLKDCMFKYPHTLEIRICYLVSAVLPQDVTLQISRLWFGGCSKISRSDWRKGFEVIQVEVNIVTRVSNCTTYTTSYYNHCSKMKCAGSFRVRNSTSVHRSSKLITKWLLRNSKEGPIKLIDKIIDDKNDNLYVRVEKVNLIPTIMSIKFKFNDHTNAFVFQYIRKN